MGESQKVNFFLILLRCSYPRYFSVSFNKICRYHCVFCFCFHSASSVNSHHLYAHPSPLGLHYSSSHKNKFAEEQKAGKKASLKSPPKTTPSVMGTPAKIILYFCRKYDDEFSQCKLHLALKTPYVYMRLNKCHFLPARSELMVTSVSIWLTLET